MKVIHQNGYTPEELLAFRPIIWKNLLQSAGDVVNALAKFNLEPITATNRVCRRRLSPITFHLSLIRLFQAICERILAYQLATDDPHFFFSPDIAQAIQDLWADEIILALMNHSSEFYLMDNAS